MKKISVSVALILISTMTFGQVGVNTASPESTLDIRAKNHLGTVSSTDGILIPRVNDLSVNGSVNGQLVYLISNAGSFTKGFYYWNGTVWTALAGGSGGTTDNLWVNDNANVIIKLGTQSDGTTARTSGTEFIIKDSGGVGIGTPSPDNSAILDINSTNKGIKLPYVALQSITDLTTIPNPANGLMVYVPNGSAGMNSGVYIFNAATNTWDQLQKISPTTGSTLSKVIYSASLGDPSKTASVGRFTFAVSNNNAVMIKHLLPTATAETISMVDNVFTSTDTFWYSNPKNISIPAGNTGWGVRQGSSNVNLSADLTTGRVITLYFADVTENKFYKVLFFRSQDPVSTYSILAEQF